MPQLQGVGFDQAAAELRSGLSVPDLPVSAFYWFVLPFALAAAGTWLALRYARKRGLLDQPGERRSHAVATPRGGGVSIAAALLVAILVLGYRHPELRPLLQAGALGLILVATVGWIDDHRPLSARARLAAHALSAGLLAAAVLLSGHGLLLAVIAFGAVLVLVNVWNFMDGINGLAASQAAIAALGYALVAGAGEPAGALGLALAGACCGFLPFNFPTARIFLGDVGSGALGQGLALLAVLLMLAPPAGFAPSLWLLLVLPLAAFLVDATLTLGRRVLRHEPWWEPHVQHAYQVWSRTLGHHAPVTLAYAVWSVIGAALMIGMTITDAALMIVFVAAGGWCLAAGLGWALLQKTSRTGKGRADRQ